MRILIRAVVLVAILGALASSGVRAQRNVGTIVTNGKILTVDDRFSIVEALAIDEGRIVARGTRQEVARYAGPKTQVIDVGGKTVIPGLIDNHFHLTRAADTWHNQTRFEGVDSRRKALETLAAKAGSMEPGEWIFVQGGWSQRQFADAPGGFTLEELDRVAPKNPLFVQEGYSFIYANSLALKAVGYEAKASIGGSFVSKNIEDYYLSPGDMGYGTFIDFDHEFIGREALQKKATAPHRQKVTLVLDEADVLHAIGSQFEPGERAKFIEFPSAVYSMHPYDKVMVGGTTVGISTWIGYSASERKMLTIAVIDAQHAKPGTTVTYVWGEEGGGTSKPAVERHRQMEIGATVAPVPYVEAVRKSYTDRGWRTAQV